MTKRTVISSIFNIFNVLLITAFLSKISLSMETPEPVIPAAIGDYRMGIEIETSALKIKSGREDKLRIDFSNRDRGLIWRLEEDTPDASLADGFYNLEAKTNPGRGFDHDEINGIAADVQRVLASLYLESQTSLLTVNERFLNRSLGGKYQIQVPYSRFCCLRCCSKFSVQANIPKIDIRPQITYQLPLQDIPRVFERLAELGHRRIVPFLRTLTPPPLPEAEIAAKAVEEEFEEADEKKPNVSTETKLSEVEIVPSGESKSGRTEAAFSSVLKKFGRNHAKPFLLTNKRAAEPIQDYFMNRIREHYVALPETPAKGLITLFLYYCYELFNNKEPVGSEIGLKKYLGIMSRIPFSQLYDRMDNENKISFREFLEPHFDFLTLSCLRKYQGYSRIVPRPIPTHPDSDDDTPPPPETHLSAAEWFRSIINPEDRYEKRDKLSPATDLKGHSMGALDLDRNANEFALIEVRGYSNLNYLGNPLIIDRIVEFIYNESQWFFRR